MDRYDGIRHIPPKVVAIITFLIILAAQMICTMKSMKALTEQAANTPAQVVEIKEDGR